MNKIDIKKYEQETELLLHGSLKKIKQKEILRDLYSFFSSYRSHFYERKSWYDARVSTLQGLVTFVLTSAAAFSGLLIQQKQWESNCLSILGASLFILSVLSIICTLIFIIIELKPRTDFKELKETELVESGVVRYKDNFLRKMIVSLALESSSNGLRIEQRYRMLQVLFRVFLISFITILVSGIILFGFLNDKKAKDYSETPAKVEIINANH